MKKRRGFSLIETMIAVMALSFTVLVFGAAFPTGSRMRQKGEYVTRATIMAQETLERLRGLGYDNLSYSALSAAGFIDSSPTSSPYSITTAAGLATALPGGSGTLTITSPETDLKMARVDITWTDTLNPQANSVTLITYLTDMGMVVTRTN
jgi:prepilin-type N-terminal cleavage/methylation domain-containing protein